MGIFDKIKKAIAPENARVNEHAGSDNEDLIKVYDEYGRELLITKEQWRKDVLPTNLENSWNDPDKLYSIIVTALGDEHFPEVLEASKQLLKIDTNKERGYIIRSIVLLKNGRLDESRDILEDYIKGNGETGYVLTNLAKVYAEEGNQEKTEEILWRALQLDPNQDNAVRWWTSINHEKGGKDAYIQALNKIAEIKGSWRAQYWLAREALENKDLELAKKYHAHVINHAKDVQDVLTYISGDLGRAGYVEEVLSTILPIYEPEKHDPYVGLNILQAYLETKRYKEGNEFLSRMFALNLPYLRENLMYYSNKFAELDSDLPQKIDDREKISAGIILLNKPIFYYGLKDAKWLLPDVERKGARIAFMPLANLSAKGGEQVEKEDYIGRLTRTIPLYLLDNLYFETDSDPQVLIPVITGGGFIVAGKEYDLDYFLDVISKSEDSRSFDYFVSGNIKEDINGLILEISIWDVNQKSKIKTFFEQTTKDKVGLTLKLLLKHLKSYFEQCESISKIKPVDYYALFDDSLVNSQLLQYGQALVLMLISNDYMKKEAMWGERGILRNPLDFTLEVKHNLIPKALFVSNLAKAHSYKSDVYQEFKGYALKLISDNSDDKYLMMLSPLIYKIYGMDKEFEECEKRLENHSEEYKAWFNKLKGL